MVALEALTALASLEASALVEALSSPSCSIYLSIYMFNLNVILRILSAIIVIEVQRTHHVKLTMIIANE